MRTRVGRTSEQDMSIAVMRYLAHQPYGEATLPEIRAAIPHYVELTEGDLAYSGTRSGEQLWEQILRNINSHKASNTNFIKRGLLDAVPGGGLRITQAGYKFLADLDESE